jgi:tRNA1(Val) A37 N6-methylase TrmN6
MDTTLDGLLNRRVMLEQPAEGYRVAVDTVLLAAAVPARAGERVLDLGCGVGGAMLCLAARVPGLSITGVEIQPELAEICRRNIARNNFDAKMDVIEGDVTSLNLPASFDHVMMNPPYYEEGRHDVSPNASKRIANTGKKGDLKLWMESAPKLLGKVGTLIAIHRSEGELGLLADSGVFGRIESLPLLPKLGHEPRRVLIRAQKKVDRQGPSAGYTRCKPLILHNEEGGFTSACDSILRHMKSIEFTEEMT